MKEVIMMMIIVKKLSVVSVIEVMYKGYFAYRATSVSFNVYSYRRNVTCRWYVAGWRSSYPVDYEQYVNRTLTPYISAARNVVIATAAAAAVVIVTLIAWRLLGRVWLRRIRRMLATDNSGLCDPVTVMCDNVIDEGHFESHLDDLCECHVTSSPVTSPAAGPLLHPCNYSETIV